jgi:hypothetical protein
MIFLIYSFSFLFFFFHSWFGLKRQAAFVLCIPKTARSLATIAPHDRLFFFLIPLAVEHPKNGYHFRDTMRSATANGFSPKPPVASRTKTCSRAWILPCMSNAHHHFAARYSQRSLRIHGEIEQKHLQRRRLELLITHIPRNNAMLKIRVSIEKQGENGRQKKEKGKGKGSAAKPDAFA